MDDQEPESRIVEQLSLGTLLDNNNDDDETPLTGEALASIRALTLTSCDFVGDSGCCDPNCWQCHSPIGPENLRCLAKNLAAAAVLCRAWQMCAADPAWRPGCHLDEGV